MAFFMGKIRNLYIISRRLGLYGLDRFWTFAPSTLSKTGDKEGEDQIFEQDNGKVRRKDK